MLQWAREGFWRMSLTKLIFTSVCVLLLSACGNNAASEDQNKGSVSDGEKSSTKQVVENTDISKTVEEAQRQPSSAKPEAQQAQSIQGDSKDDEAGYSVVDGKIEEAAEIPAEDKKQLLAAFKEYMDAFNAKDLERYEAILAQNPEGFNLQEDLNNAAAIFKDFDIKRTATNVTITDYSGNRAYIYADFIIDVKQENTEAKDEVKQLTQFVKESTGWKVTSLQAIGSAAKGE